MFRKTLIAIATFAAVSSATHAASFSAGDIVIYRVGDGAAALSSAAQKVFLDEYNTSGTLIQSVLVTGTNLLTASGTATSEGLLTLSSDGSALVLTGYNVAVGTASVASSTASRTVGLVSVGTGNVDTTTTLNTFSGNNIRSAASDGTNIWAAGANSGIVYTTVGGSGSFTTISTTVANNRQLQIFNGQLYSSDSSGSAVRIGTDGVGLPTTSGQTITNLPGFPTSGSPYSFFFADLDSTVSGVDTLYVADDTNTVGVGGITKYSLLGGNWINKGTVGTAADAYRGLTGVVTGGTVQLFATRKGGSGSTGGGELVSLLDTSGYNNTLSSGINLLATATTNEAFRGVAYITAAVPEPETYAMLLAGLGLLGFAARRRAK